MRSLLIRISNSTLTPIKKLPLYELLHADLLQTNAYHAHVVSVKLRFQRAQLTC